MNRLHDEIRELRKEVRTLTSRQDAAQSQEAQWMQEKEQIMVNIVFFLHVTAVLPWNALMMARCFGDGRRYTKWNWKGLLQSVSSECSRHFMTT